MADAFDPFSAWTVHERRPNRRLPRKSGLAKSASTSLLSRADRFSSSAGESNCSTPLPQSDGGYASFKARFLKEYQQQQRMQSMAVSRRQRKVAETLQDSRDLFLYPDSRLAAAAAAEAEELARLFRTPKEQRASCSSLAQPRALPEAELPQEPQSIPRSWAEQQAYLRELAEPRQPELELLPERRCDRSLAEQQRRCAELAQPRVQRGTDDVAAWRDELAFKAAALVPEEVQAARDLLEKMRCRPRSAKKVREAKAPAPEVEEQLKELKAAVEEILWVALLQVRSCPKPQTAAAAGAVEERLGALLISSVGPALRPVARRLLGPGQGLARRLRTEFPKLARHLCFREAEDLEPPQSSWQEEEVSLHLAKARECRDSLLAMDLIKDAVARLGDLEPRA